MRIRKVKGQRKDTCSKCGNKLDTINQRYCKACHAADMRTHRLAKKYKDGNSKSNK